MLTDTSHARRIGPAYSPTSFVGGVFDRLGLTKLPEYWPTAVSSFLVFTLIHQVVAPVLSRIVAPASYNAIKSKRTRNTWGIHFTSQCHVLLIVPLAIWCIRRQAEDSRWDELWERAFGWDERAAYVNAIACGYFLWDSLDAVINFIDTGYVIHGIVCCLVYFMSFKPFASYYALRFLLWETSTLFLNNHWFLDKTNRTGSTLQLVNGICLLTAFIYARIIYGGWISFHFLTNLWHVYKDAPLYVFVSFTGDILLQGLNLYWLTKIIAALCKRFDWKASETTQLPNNPTNLVPNAYEF